MSVSLGRLLGKTPENLLARAGVLVLVCFRFFWLFIVMFCCFFVVFAILVFFCFLVVLVAFS